MSTPAEQIPNESRYQASLRAVALHVSQFLTADSADTIPAILATIAESLQVDRVLVLEQHPTGPTLCYSWQSPAVPEVTLQSFSVYPSITPEVREWLSPLGQGKPVMNLVHEVNGPVADLFRKFEIQSILIVPITVAGTPWGSLGVDACRSERRWSVVEIELVQILANLIGITILRDRHTQSMRNSEQKFRTVAETAHDAIIVTDSHGVVRYWNRSAQRIMGYSKEEAVGKSVHQWLAPFRFRGQAAAGLHVFAASGAGHAIGRTQELTAIRKDGLEIPVELALASMQIDGEWCAVGILRDISVRRETEQRLNWLARHDAVTALPNRTVFVDELQHAIARSQRTEGHFAAYYLDLDHFKDVNDTLGHPAGDLLLKAVAERLKKTIRETDKVARFGGDEFAVLATELADPTDAGIVASKLLSAMSEPFLINGAEVHTGVTIGIASQSQEREDAETLLAHADVALYHAKSEGRGTFRFFTEAMDNEVRQRVTLLAELREAITQGQLFLMYQPQVDMETRSIVGLEALVRWRHPTRGLISPGHFIPAAENSGLIISVGQWVLPELCRQARAWLDLGIRVPVIAMNVSPTQFKAPLDLSSEVAAALWASQINPDRLEIELTETTLMRASRYSADVLQRLRDQGIRMAIDDFGTGYSSLDYLRRFPASRIKIAQTFIADVAHDAGSAAITRAAISLGRELGLSVIAEGIETAQQVALLTQWGCKEAQGFYFSKPLSPHDVLPLLRAGTLDSPH